jgi:diguanylate cyclase (GGDEF)-like protein/PAS domain S-box-containing protein
MALEPPAGERAAAEDSERVLERGAWCGSAGVVRALIVDDCPRDVELIVAALAAGGSRVEWERVDTAPGMAAALARGGWDIVLCEPVIERFGSGQALELLAGVEDAPAAIVVSGVGGEEVTVAAIRAGAVDFVSKARLARLDGAVQRALGDVACGRERRRLERELTRLGEATEHCSDAVMSVDLAARVPHWNRGAERLFGFTAAEAIGRSLYELTVFNDEPRDQVARMLAGDDVYQYETRRRRKDGRIVDVLLTVSPWHLDGRVVGVTGIATDITEPKDRERERERMAAAAEYGTDAVISVDLDGRVRHWNHGAERLFGFLANEAIGHDLRALTMVDAEVSGNIARVLAGEPAFQYESQGRRKHGALIDVLITILPWRVGRELAGATAVTIDITERKRVEQATASLAAIVASSDDAIIGQTLQGEITSWNPAAERIYGYPAAETLGRSISILCPSSREDDEATEMLVQVAAGERIDHFQTTRWRKDATVIDVAVTLSPIRDGDGAVVGASSVARDVTGAKRAADALAEAEERFQGAFEDAPIGMALLNLDAEFTKVNDSWCQITGYTATELEGATLATILHVAEAASVLVALNATADGEQAVYAGENRFVHAGGQPVWVALQLTLIRDHDDRPLRLIAQAQDITERKGYEQRLQDLADHDALTGLLNRRSFTRELDSHAARVTRYGPEGALLIVDLDHFKYINDTLGHHAGDEIIRAVASDFAARLRSSDILARLDGDEFAVLLPKADITAAHRVARELQHALARQHAAVAATGVRAATASIGIAPFEPQLTSEEVLVNADLAMYDAKEAGRNQITVYRPDDRGHGPMKGRVNWISRIQAALEHQHLTLLAQPIVDYRTGRTTQHELLLRMRDQDGQLLAPAAFLGIAERLDLIQEIDAWVVRHAIALLADDQPSLPERLPVHVNLSGRSLGDPKLLELIEAELDRTRVAPGRLIFEITETAAVRHITQARRFGQRLAQLGCALALDDFGAGFGSFYYLKHLPFDYIKIDGEFVRDCVNDTTDQAVIQAVVGIARGLGKQTIAEFVEDEPTARLLTRLGVDYGQGYHHGRPAPITSTSTTA